MLPEIGFFSILLAFIFSLFQYVVPLLNIYKKNQLWDEICVTAVRAQFIFLTFALFSLMICFVQNDVTVWYVREHSHAFLPFKYRIAATWGGHEGSLLLWCYILSIWTLLFSWLGKRALLHGYFIKILAILGFISSGFILFLLATSNPFQRDFPENPIKGNDLMPLLQDPGLLFHPPSLYLGYVGFAVAFAFGVSALIEGKVTAAWARSCRTWILLPWAYLGSGIILGSAWAYRELGWGGWWFWDPVENASLLPWLIATALIHSLIVSEKRNTFKGWTILLCILTFAFSLIGTFLVRSGVLVSVHSFASDPARGVFLLAFLSLLIGGAFLLYSLRIGRLYQTPQFKILSRETLLLINSVVLLIIVLTITLGTLYPILLDALDLEKISVGEPYFNVVFTPMMLGLLLLMGLAPHVKWQNQAIKTLWRKLIIPFLLSIGLALATPWFLNVPLYLFATIGFTLAYWVMIATLLYFFKLYPFKSIQWSSQLPMIIAHIGVALLTFGITLNQSYSEERQVKIHLGEATTLAGYDFIFQKSVTEKHQNYQSLKVIFSVEKNNRLVTQITPEQRNYLSNGQILSIPGIRYNAYRDLYMSLGTQFPDRSWMVRIYYKPAVRWIWAGGWILILGGLLAIISNRRSR